MRCAFGFLALFTLAFGLCDLNAPPALAADPQSVLVKPQDPGALFDKLDTEHKGVLSAEQIPADKRGLFERLLRLAGKPADGQLTRDEFVAQLKSISDPPAEPASTASKPKPETTAEKPAKPAEESPAAPSGRKINPERMFDRLDKNHDGKLTINDVPEKRQRFFKRLLRAAGKPDDGSLTKDEFVKAVDTVLAARRPGAGGNAANKTSTDSKSSADSNIAAGLNAGQGFDIDKVVNRLMKRSSRSDGKLTKTDLPERLQNRFDKIDGNGDGLVDAAELRAWLGKVKHQLASAKTSDGSGSDSTKSDNK